MTESTQGNQAAPAAVSFLARIWQGIVAGVSDVYAFATSPQGHEVEQAAIDVGLTVSGNAAIVPAANIALGATGELLAAAHKAMKDNPGAPLTTAGIVSNLNLAQSSLDQIAAVVTDGHPTVAATLHEAAAASGAAAQAIGVIAAPVK